MPFGDSSWLYLICLAGCLPAGQPDEANQVPPGDTSDPTGAGDGTGTGDGGTTTGDELIFSGTLTTDPEGNTDLQCMDIPTLGNVYEFSLSHDSIEWMELMIGPEWSQECAISEPEYWADDYDCVVAPYEDFREDSGWKYDHPPAALRINLEHRWCVWGQYAEIGGAEAAGQEIGLTVRDLGPDGVGSGPCGQLWEYSHCACDDPAPASCP